MRIKLRLIVLIILINFFTTGCLSDSNADNPIPSVPFSILLSGENTLSGVFENRKIEIFKDQSSLNASLATHVLFIREQTVDFSKNQAVLVNMGQRRTGGYSVKIDEILDFPDQIKIKITLGKPGSSCVVTQALTSPYEFIEVQSTKEILFEERLVINNCN